MNREDIIRMAREAGFADGIAEFIGLSAFDRFAALVASAEHKRVQQVYTDAATDSVKAAIAYEREACAKVCDDIQDCGPENGCCPTYWNEALDCATAAIRARGQA